MGLFARLISELGDYGMDWVVPLLFQGEMVSTISCTNIRYQTHKHETFRDIQLDIVKNKNIYDSLDVSSSFSMSA